MGLPNWQKYETTKHFRQRAMERFGIDPTNCLKWFQGQASTATEYKSLDSKFTAGRIAYLSKDGVILIVEPKKLQGVTCYPAIDIIQEEDKEESLAQEELVLKMDKSLDSNLFEETSIEKTEGDHKIDDAPTTIHEENFGNFQKEVRKLARKYELRDARELLVNIEDEIETIYENYHKIKTGALTEANHNKLQDLIASTHILLGAIRILETTRLDYQKRVK